MKQEVLCVGPRFSSGVAAVVQFTLDFSVRIISPLLHRAILFGGGGASESHRSVATKEQKASFSSVCRSAKGTAVTVAHLLEPWSGLSQFTRTRGGWIY